MKKRYTALIAVQLILISAPALAAQSWATTCKIYLASGMVTAINTIMEMAAQQLAMQGDPLAAELLLNIHRSKPARQLACEAGTQAVGGIFNKVISSLSASPAVRSAIRSALDTAIYKVLHESIRWF